jgi:hypothetical protein
MSTSRDRYPLALRGWRLDLINGEATGGSAAMMTAACSMKAICVNQIAGLCGHP